MIKFNLLKLIVDIGNSRIKLALFQNKNLVKWETISNLTKDNVLKFCGNNKITSSIFSSVRILSKNDKEIITLFNGILIDQDTPLPIKSSYESYIGCLLYTSPSPRD